MKTSNYILTAFLTFLFGGVLVMAVAAKFHKETNNEIQYRYDEKKLESFSVIVAESGAHFQVITGDYPCIRSLYKLPDSCKFPPFSIKNDTLFVLANTTTYRAEYQDYIYCKNIKSIVARENTNLRLQDFKIRAEDTLIVKLNKANMKMFLLGPNNQPGGLYLQAQQSVIYIQDLHCKTIDVNIDKSKIRTFNSSFGHLSGTISNYSELYTNVMEQISVAVDSTSKFNISK